jgi:hypothetical protein
MENIYETLTMGLEKMRIYWKALSLDKKNISYCRNLRGITGIEHLTFGARVFILCFKH